MNHMTQVIAMANPKGNLATLKSYQPKWESGPTRTIRVPIVLADCILEYAHKIDSNSLSQVNNNQADTTYPDTADDGASHQAKFNYETLTQVIEVLEEVQQTPRNNFNRERKAMLRKAIEKLKSLSQAN